MATQTAVLAEADDSKVLITATYDDATFAISAITVNNQTAFGATVTATRIEDGRKASHTFPAGFTTVFNVAAFSLTLTHGTPSPDPAHPNPPPTAGILVALQWPAASGRP